MKKFIYVVLSVVFAGSITGCAHEPIYNVEHHVMPFEAKKLTSQEIGRRICHAVAKRGWRCDETTPCVLICHLQKRTHKAIVQIDYNKDFFSIHNVKSENLDCESGMIHSRYNKWVRNMEKDIMNAISLPVCKPE